MIRNYFKTAIRNLIKYKGYSFINITGLAMGIACCLLIILYVKDELTFDRFHQNGKNIYRMQSSLLMNDNKQVFNAVNLPAGPTLKEELPEVIEQVRFLASSLEIKVGEKEFNEGNAYYTEPQFLDIFNFPPIEGEGVSSLQSTSQIVLTRETAEKYFGRTDVIGESLQVKMNGEWRTFHVGAVLKNVPSNSSLDFNLLLPFEVYLASNNRQGNEASDWQRIEISFQTFIVAVPGIEKQLLTDKMDEVKAKYMNGVMAEMMRFEIQPLWDIHFDPSATNGDGMREASNKVYSMLLSGIAFVILILACINFTNLSVARALPRAKEIGVRKVVGAVRGQLVAQFLSEALFVSMVAFVVGLALAQLVLPSFERITEKEFSVAIVDDLFYVLLSFIVVLLAAFVAGIYPAIMISRFNPVKALKGNLGRFGGKHIISKVLVVFQFTIAAVLIIGTLTMNRQITYMINKDKGYTDENIIGIPLVTSERDHGDGNSGRGERMLNLIENELSNSPTVTSVTGKSSGLNISMMMRVDETTGERQQVRSYMQRVTPGFVETLGIEILEGRGFDPEKGETERDKILVNESFAKKMNWGDTVVGRNFGFGENPSKVIGLVKDYNFRSLVNEVEPIVINQSRSQPIGEILVKFKEGTLTESLAATEAAWKKFNPLAPFEHFLLEERNADAYSDQVRWRSILIIASLVAIVISCLGLFGLAYMSTQRRAKEIGVRKVLGASIPMIVFILSRGFSSLVFISFVIACPLAYYGAEEWLSGFPYRIRLGADMFIIAGVVMIVVAWLTVSWHSVKTAVANPVKALRYE